MLYFRDLQEPDKPARAEAVLPIAVEYVFSIESPSRSRRSSHDLSVSKSTVERTVFGIEIPWRSVLISFPSVTLTAGSETGCTLS